MRRFKEFYDAYNFLKNHDMCKCERYINGKVSRFKMEYFYKCLDVSVVKVNPKNDTLEVKGDRIHLNTKTQVWLEFGRAFLDLDSPEHVQFEHDYNLDCGGDTFEEAIVELANLVDKYYYDDGSDKIINEEGR